MENLPNIRKLALWVGGPILAITLVWLVAKTLLPFAIGVVCGVAARYFWDNRS
jgi:hypothetical protein